MLIGKYEHSLDNKKRLSIPAKWRSVFGEKIIITAGMDKSLFIYSMDEWHKIAADISSKDFLNQDVRNLSRMLLSNAFDISIDSHGRVLLPDHLIDYANLKTDTVLAGNYNRCEVWDKKEFEKNMKNITNDFEQISKRLSVGNQEANKK